MTSPPMDALASFAYLTNQIPTWTIKINTLAAHVLTKREEFTAEYKRVLEHARPRRKKTPSTSSLLTNDEQPSITSHRDRSYARDISAVPRMSEISPLEPENKYLFANARRGKRKPGTSLRSGASGPQTFRNQHQVIIYYDAILQHGFEGLVKDIGTARNNLRKGKQVSDLERGLRLPPLGINNYSRRPRNPGLPSAPMSCTATDTPREPKLLPNDSPCDDTPFTQAAKDLEAAQALCEKAAHQFLRDGDCTLEIDQIRTYFENVLQVARTHVLALERERNAELSNAEHSKAALTVDNHETFPTAAEKIGVNIRPVPTPDATEIEVDSDDDSDQDDMVIDISRFRAARVRGMRA